MKDENTRNTILALILSAVVLIAWQYFVVAPRVEMQKARDAALQKTAETQTAPAAPAGGPSVKAPIIRPRDEALASGARVKIDTPSLSGSLNLKGGRIDDLALKNYRATIEKGSPNIVLFSPSGTMDAYYAEVGYVAPQGASFKVPDGTSEWGLREGYALSPGMPVRLEFNNGQGLTFRRIYRVDQDYMFTVDEEVVNNGREPVTLYPYALLSRHGRPKTAGTYVIHEGMLGVFGETGLKEFTYDKLQDSLSITEKASSGWLGITDKYWAAALIPDQKTNFTGRFSANKNSGEDVFQADYLLDGQTIAPGATLKLQHRLFAGAKEVAVVDHYRSKENIDRFDLMIDWGWFYFFTKPLFYTIDFFYRLLGNFGVAILLVTVIVKLLFFPLANRSYVSMSKMRKVQPELTRIKERHPDDKLKQQQEMMELYKREKINPVSGCLPVLIQIPVFFALYKVIYTSIEMRHAPFFGWIQDLSAPDPTSLINLFGLLPFTAPAFLHIGIWPLIMGFTMWLQMKMNPAPTDPAQKVVFSWMPLLFTFMLASFPAGLVIYWAWNNTLSIAQQWAIMRQQGVKVELGTNLLGTFSRAAKRKMPGDET